MKQELISLALGLSVMMSSALGFAQTPAQETADPRVEEAANTVHAFYERCLQRQISPDQYNVNSMTTVMKLKTGGVLNEAEFAEVVDYINNSTERCRIFQNHFKTFEKANEQLANGQISVDTYRAQCVASLKTALDNNIIPQEQYNESLANIEAIIADYLKKHPESQTAGAAQPSQPVVQPSQPAVQPTQPAVQPTQPAVQPTQPAVQPTQPAVQPAQPAVQPTQPAVQPAQPAVQPAQPAVQPAQPVVQPTPPVTQPAQPIEQPIAQSAQPIEQPAQPDVQPTQPIAQSTQPTEQPAQPAVQPTQPIAQAAQPIDQPAQPSTQAEASSSRDQYYQQLGAAMLDYSNGKINENELRSRYSDTLNSMIRDGIITQDQRTQILDSLAPSIEKANKNRWFREEIRKINDRFEVGYLTSKRWEKEALALIAKMEKDKAMSPEEANQYREQIRQRLYDYRHMHTNEVYITDTYQASGSIVYETHREVWTDAESHSRPSAFQLSIGLVGGVIFDFQSSFDDFVYDEKYDDPQSFWANRHNDEILGYAGLHLALGYTWRKVTAILGIGLFLRQDLGYGFWTGDAAKYYDPQFMGMTTGGIRLELRLKEGELVWLYDFGIGMAYGAGDDRSEKDKNDYAPAYFFDTAFNNSAYLDILVGTSFDYFVSDYIGIGIGLYVNFAILDTSVTTKEKDHQYQYYTDKTAYISHFVPILTPDLHLIIDI